MAQPVEKTFDAGFWLGILVLWTFVAHSTEGGLIAPWVLDGAMNRASFDACIKSQPAPALRPGQIVAADNLSSHKSSQALKLLRAQGRDLIFLPPYEPDLNPPYGDCRQSPTGQRIEIIRAFLRTDGSHALLFSKLKALIRKAAARPSGSRSEQSATCSSRRNAETTS